MREASFQSKLIKQIKELYPGCVVLKNDPNYKQGIPDLLVLYEDKWAALEVKADSQARHQPNQDYYIDILNKMSYATFVYPENLKEVLDGLSRTFGSARSTCTTQS